MKGGKTNYGYKNNTPDRGAKYLSKSNISNSNKRKYDKAISELNSLYNKSSDKKNKHQVHNPYSEMNNSQFSSYYNKNSL